MSRGVSTHIFLAFLGSLTVLGASAHAADQQGRFAAQAAITPGKWTVQVRDGATRTLCIPDALPLIQLAHPQSGCRRLMIVDRRDSATIQYSCPAAGWGRTSIRIDSPRRVEIDTQGIVQNQPYAYQASAHYTGYCTAATHVLTKPFAASKARLSFKE